jgi:hypothetical protein
MNLLTVKCPACAATKGHRFLARSEYPPVAPQVVGGVIWALVFALSRKRRFRCGNCAKEFFSHTLGSRAWLTVWVFFCLGMAVTIVGIFVSLLLH